MDNMQAELATLTRDIRDLKTAQTQPGTSTLYRFLKAISTGTYNGVYTATIQYEDVGSSDAPITVFTKGTNWTLWPYDAATNTQRIEWFADDQYTSGDNMLVKSTRPIASISNLAKTNDIDEYSPPSTWTQVRSFNIANMGTTEGWCLRNCCLGFGITGGGFPTARADMESQRTNGTLHNAGGTPPSYIQVPVYIDTGVAEGHVVVWDKGTVYSDGVRISQGLSYYGMSNIWGWGELCGGYRVVQRS